LVYREALSFATPGFKTRIYVLQPKGYVVTLELDDVFLEVEDLVNFGFERPREIEVVCRGLCFENFGGSF
jgi:hypothetical protein